VHIYLEFGDDGCGGRRLGCVLEVDMHFSVIITSSRYGRGIFVIRLVGVFSSYPARRRRVVISISIRRRAATFRARVLLQRAVAPPFPRGERLFARVALGSPDVVVVVAILAFPEHSIPPFLRVP